MLATNTALIIHVRVVSFRSKSCHKLQHRVLLYMTGRPHQRPGGSTGGAQGDAEQTHCKTDRCHGLVSCGCLGCRHEDGPRRTSDRAVEEHSGALPLDGIDVEARQHVDMVSVTCHSRHRLVRQRQPLLAPGNLIGKVILRYVPPFLLHPCVPSMHTSMHTNEGRSSTSTQRRRCQS